eukprot:gi/632991615/ref/XP_007884708.1/ PREDICTED: insulinoma-associated protein 1b-like [Callorhinchus milii]
MPRGFLVKRTRHPALISYRVRGEDGSQGNESLAKLPWPCGAGSSLSVIAALQKQPLDFLCRPQSPKRPVNTDHISSSSSSDHRSANSTSPVLAETFPNASSAHPVMGRPQFLASLTRQEAEMGSFRLDQPPAKRSPQRAEIKPQRVKRVGVERKAPRRDDFTTSPVLGLHITEEPGSLRPKDGGKSLCEFICQLCRLEYSDPLSLAQHKCPRILKVEYRCSECVKVFSCPANLASHRRWHKPRLPGVQQGVPKEVKEKAGGSSQRENLSPSSRRRSFPGRREEALECRLCGKLFRRQTDLKKHQVWHQTRSLRPADRERDGPSPRCRAAGQAEPVNAARQNGGSPDCACRGCSGSPAAAQSPAGLQSGQRPPEQRRGGVLLLRVGTNSQTVIR